MLKSTTSLRSLACSTRRTTVTQIPWRLCVMGRSWSWQIRYVASLFPTHTDHFIFEMQGFHFRTDCSIYYWLEFQWLWQDQDGSHIKGLLINFIHHNWPSLLRHNFIEEFITPIIKVSLISAEMQTRCTWMKICLDFYWMYPSKIYFPFLVEDKYCILSSNTTTLWQYYKLKIV